MILTWRQLVARIMTSDLDLDAKAELRIDDRRSTVLYDPPGRFVLCANVALFTQSDLGREGLRSFAEGREAGRKEEDEKKAIRNSLNLKGGVS